MKDDAVRAYRFNIPKVYALVYSLVALPMVYYGLSYIKLVNGQMSVSLPLLGLVMTLSFVGSYIVQDRTNRQIMLFLRDGVSRINDPSELKKAANAYPLRLVAVMVFGWIVLLNVIVFLPVFFIFDSSLSDLITCNLLVFSSGLMSAPMTYFISERTVGIFLSLDEIKAIPEPPGLVRLSLTFKILAVCLIIIVALILNTSVAMLLSVACDLSQTASIVNLVVISVLGVADAVIVSLLFARSLTLPIANFCAGTEQVKSGDLSFSVPRLSNDELGDSSSYFNAFVSKLEEIVREIKSSVSNTGENAGNLQRAMEDTGRSVDEIHRFSTGVEASVTDQAAIVTGVTATIRQIARTIENQDRRIGEQASSVAESSSAIEEMIANIQSISGNLKTSAQEFERLQTALSAGNRNVDALKSNVLVLSEQSDSVFQANSIIKHIAAQTNLLAMNAAIEAAHAGDAGQGFAVVADEIRKLAEVSNHQSKLISDSLKVLKHTIDQAVAMTGSTGSSFEVILSSVQTVNGLELEIKHAIDEQSTGGSQILKTLSGMNEITAEVKSGSTQMLTGSNKILSEAVDLLGITTRVKEAAAGVVDKAMMVKKNTGEAMSLLVRNTENMQKIDGKVSFFKVDGA